MKVQGSLLDLVNKRIINVDNPTAAQDAATKDYVDGVVRGLDWKEEVVAASTANVDLAAPGTALDGVTLAVNDRILLKDQTAQDENGIYVWTGAAAALTRSTDADTADELSGSTVTVQRGTVNADRVYRVITDDPFTLDTDPVQFAQVGAGGASYTAGDGLTLSGSAFAVGAGTGISVTADEVAVDTSVVARKYSTNVGNGAATSIAVVHNLGTRDVQVTVYDAATWEEVLVDNVRTDANTVTLTFGTAPASNAYRVVVVG